MYSCWPPPQGSILCTVANQGPRRPILWMPDGSMLSYVQLLYRKGESYAACPTGDKCRILDVDLNDTRFSTPQQHTVQPSLQSCLSFAWQRWGLRTCSRCCPLQRRMSQRTACCGLSMPPGGLCPAECCPSFLLGTIPQCGRRWDAALFLGFRIPRHILGCRIPPFFGI
jgi:hypothetical protein